MEAARHSPPPSQPPVVPDEILLRPYLTRLPQIWTRSNPHLRRRNPVAPLTH